MLRYVGLVASLLFSRTLGSDVMHAIFDLSESYVSGSVNVSDGRIMINLNISKLLSSGLLPNGCQINENNGILYHVHTKWAHSASLGSSYLTGCNATYTAGHYDPYTACGSASGSSYCSVNGGCVSQSYSCSNSKYMDDSYACEVGDWSGKYGATIYNNGTVWADLQSFGEITGDQLVGKSIVFHCANNKARAFCASFQSVAGSVTGTARRQYNGYKLKADFSSALGLSSDKDAYFTMNYDGQVTAKFSQNSLNSLSCPGGKVAAWVGDAWNDGLHVSLNGSACTTSVRGWPHDPTNQCYASTTNSDFCTTGKLCNSSSYTYACNYTRDPFSCSPMDLSGRYGSVDISLNSNSDISMQTTDRYMADLTGIKHKSLVLSCVSSGKPLLCAKWQSVAVGTAVATFTNGTGGLGTVTVTNGQVSFDVSFAYAAAHFLNNVTLPGSCFNNGLKAHIHEKWTYGSDTTARYGPTACGKSFTGGHWDPWAACSTTTGYTSVCSIPPTPSPTACVAVGGASGHGKYQCNSTSYLTNPFLCEVGDWSAKYGTYQFSEGYQITRTDHSPMEVDASELVGRSIVFHCATDASRAFCAPFILQGQMDGEDSEPDWPLTTQPNNQYGMATATLYDDEGSIMLQSNGYYSVDIDLSNDMNCTSTIAYAVFKNEDCTSTYDPTVQCLPITEYSDTMCFSDETCDVTFYECEWDDSPYSCSPSDLSGKYGITNSGKKITTSGWDDLMIPLSHLNNRYLGVYCTDTWEVIQCQPWSLSAETTTTTTTQTPTEPTETTKSIGHKQSCGIGLTLALLVIMNFLY